MLNITEKVTNKIFEKLRKDSSSALYINIEKDNEKEEKDVRYINLTDRIPSKKFDLIIANIKDDEADKERIIKYLSKFNKYLVLLTPAYLSIPKTGPSLTINTKGSKISSFIDKFLQVTKNYPEFEKTISEIDLYIERNFLKLGGVDTTHAETEGDIQIFFKTDELKDQFISYYVNKINVEFIHNFYTYSLEKYAAGIDKRNVRFQKNMSYIVRGARRSLSEFSGNVKAYTNKSEKSIKNTSLRVTKKIALTKENIKSTVQAKRKVKEEQQQAKKPEAAVKTKSVLQKKTSALSQGITNGIFSSVIANIDKVKIKIYKDKNLHNGKPIPYENVTAKKRVGVIGNIKDRRIMQKMKNAPKISLIMIVDDIDEIWLNKSVRSIKDQTYKNWEFVILDNCSPRTYLKSYLSSLNDPRIKTHFYNTKKTYAECLAHACRLSKGDYVGIIEEGDEIDTNSLFEMYKVIQNDQNIDFIYTDEDKINEQGKKVRPFFKPQWDKTMITAYPYAKYLFIIKRELLERLDTFKSYSIKDPIWDLLLHVNESTNNIYHLTQILYHKRIRPLKKKDPSNAYPDALKNYISRETIQGVIKPSTFEGAYYIEKKLLTNPKIGIVTFDKNQENLDAFIAACKGISKNYEIHVGIEKSLDKRNNEEVFFHKFDEFHFSKNVNAMCREIDADYLLFLDSRLRGFNHNFLELLLSYTGEHAITGTKILDPDNLIQHSIYVKNYKNIVSTLYEGMLDQKQFEISVARECSAVSKKCMLVKKELFDTIQFDEKFLTSYQDIDFCFEANKNDIKTIFVPDAMLHTSYSFYKEKFTDSDTAKFINKWKDELTRPDVHLDVKRFTSVKS